MPRQLGEMSKQEWDAFLADVPRITKEDMADYGIKLEIVGGFDDRPGVIEASIKCLADKFEAAEAIARAMGTS